MSFLYLYVDQTDGNAWIGPDPGDEYNPFGPIAEGYLRCFRISLTTGLVDDLHAGINWQQVRFQK